MHFDEDPSSIDEILLTCATGIANGLTRAQYSAWVPAEIGAVADQLFAAIPASERPGAIRLLVREIWNVTPIPAKGFRLDPFPVSRRNDLCPCDSGRKFKRCCINLPPFPLTGISMWPYLLDALSVKQMNEAIASKQIPKNLYSQIATNWLEDDNPGMAIKLLEPLFEPQRKVDQQLGHALNVLCDALDMLGLVKKKIKLLKRIASANVEISADAWQRLVTILIDAEDFKGANAAFKKAMQSRPDDPNLAPLEVLLMIRQGKNDESVRERVRFWKKRLLRLGFANDPIMGMLNDAEKDPYEAFAISLKDSHHPAFNSLQGWLSKVLLDRELPNYILDSMVPGPEGHVSLSDAARISESLLVTPPSVVDAEAGWEKAFAVGKPFSVQSVAYPEAWQQTNWLTYLQQHDVCADSLSILDDLVSILDGYPQIEWFGVAKGVYEPIFERACAIIEKCLTGTDSTLPWLAMDNRPGLRLLYRRSLYFRDMEDERECSSLEFFLRINPNDNQGVRTLLINLYLREGKDREAIALAHTYPADMLVDINFSNVLAHYRLGQLKDAESLLRKAHYEHPLVARMLWRKRVKQPALQPNSITLGGEDEAWIYRDEMRETWAATPSALDWLRKITGEKR